MRGTNFIDLMKQHGKEQADQQMICSTGYITSIDGEKYQAKVMLEPLGMETGWLTIGTMYSGNGFGFVAYPEEGAEVTVQFEHGDINCGKIVAFHHNDSDMPPSVAPGEAILMHKTGGIFKFNANGDVNFTSNGNMNITATSNVNIIAADNVNINASGSLSITSEGTTTVNGTGTMNISASGGINLAGGGQPLARVGDSVSCPAGHGTITSGSSNVTCG